MTHPRAACSPADLATVEAVMRHPQTFDAPPIPNAPPVTEPILGKARPDHRDHRPMTWRRFLILREWAQRVSKEHGVSVYLVGSVLTKTRPRDVDVAVVWPEAEFVRLFGPIPPNSLTRDGKGRPTPMGLYLAHVHHRTAEQMVSLHDPHFDKRLRVRVDVHFCPDTWWTDRDRLPLALFGPTQGAAA